MNSMTLGTTIMMMPMANPIQYHRFTVGFPFFPNAELPHVPAFGPPSTGQ
jgi:hypothetical protein